MERFVDTDPQIDTVDSMSYRSVYKARQDDELFYIKYAPDVPGYEIESIHALDDEELSLYSKMMNRAGVGAVTESDMVHPSLQAEIAASVVLERLPVRSPAFQYDHDNSRLFVESSAGATPALDDDPVVESVHDYAAAVASKVVVGDPDISPNIVADGEGCYPIDFEESGHTYQGCTMRNMVWPWNAAGSPWAFYEELRGDAVLSVETMTGEELDMESMDALLYDLVSDVDLSQVEQVLHAVDALDGFDRLDNYSHNIAFLRDYLD